MPPASSSAPPSRPGARAPGVIALARALHANSLSALSDVNFERTRVSTLIVGRTVHVLSGPEEIRAVLQDDAAAWRKSPLVQRMLRPVLGESVLTANGETWKRHRMAMTPGLARARVLDLAPAMLEAAGTVCDALAASGGRPVEITGPLNVATLSVIERALFTLPGSAFGRETVRAAIETLLADIGAVRITDHAPLPDKTQGRLGAPAVVALAVLRAALDTEIADRRKQGAPGEDLLGLLIGAGFDDVVVRDNLIGLVAAGHESTALALTWALALLADHPDVQERLAAECRDARSAEPDPARRLDRLGYARQVIEEALRLYPPAPLLGRRAVRATQIAGHEVKAGDMAMIAFYALHRHRRFWDSPDAFDPDRFAPQRRPTDPWIYRPFGGGPRACIGMALAMTEATLILGELAARFRFSLDGPPPEPMMMVTLRPKHGLTLRAEARD